MLPTFVTSESSKRVLSISSSKCPMLPLIVSFLIFFVWSRVMLLTARIWSEDIMIALGQSKKTKQPTYGLIMLVIVSSAIIQANRVDHVAEVSNTAVDRIVDHFLLVVQNDQAIHFDLAKKRKLTSCPSLRSYRSFCLHGFNYAKHHKQTLSIMHIDVSRAYCYAKVQGPVLVLLTLENRTGQIRLSKKSMYGTRHATSNWKRDLQQFSSKNLFRRDTEFQE